MGTVGGQRFSGLSKMFDPLSSISSSGCIFREHSESCLSHSCVVLAVCLGLMFSLEVNLWTSLWSWGLWTMFSLWISLYFAVFSFPSTLTSFPVPASEKHPHCFTVWRVLHRWQEVPGFLHMWCSELRFIRPESLVSQSESHLGAFFVALTFICPHWGEASV